MRTLYIRIKREQFLVNFSNFLQVYFIILKLFKQNSIFVFFISILIYFCLDLNYYSNLENLNKNLRFLKKFWILVIWINFHYLEKQLNYQDRFLVRFLEHKFKKKWERLLWVFKGEKGHKEMDPDCIFFLKHIFENLLNNSFEIKYSEIFYNLEWIFKS